MCSVELLMKGCDAHKGSNDSKLLKIKDAGVFRLLGSVVASGAPPWTQVVGCPTLLDR